MIIGDLITRNASRHPNKPAIKFGGRTLSFAQFNTRVNRLIDALLQSGFKKGDRLALLSNNSPEFLEVFGAAEKGGFVAVPLNWRLTSEELLALLRDARPAVLFVQQKHITKIREIQKELGSIHRLVEIDGLEPGFEEYGAFLSKGADQGPEVSVEEDDVVYFIYTSGTTGTPRAAMHTHRGQLAHARCIVSQCEIAPDDVNLNVMPLFHIGGHMTRLTHFHEGCLNVIQESFDAAGVLKAIEEEGVTFVHLVPTMVAFILDLPDVDNRKLSSLRTLFYAASPMPVELLRRALKVFGPIFMQSYGQSESGPTITVLHKADHIEVAGGDGLTRLASAGRPADGVELEIHGPDDLPVSSGEVGEICARSPFLMRGYWEKPELTADALRGGWLHTGDMGFVDKEGFLFVADRKKDMIISGGENIYPREVEEVLYRHPAVLEAAVIGIPDEKWGEGVKAFVVLKQGAHASESEIIEFCKMHLASYKKPKTVEFRTDLPKSPAGKILKKELRVGRADERG